MADITLRAKYHPEANGRSPLHNEEQWIVTIPLDNRDLLHLQLGKKDRDILFGMLIADCQNSGEEEPA